MSFRALRRSARLAALLGAVVVIVMGAPAGFAQPRPGAAESTGQSTPGVIITAQNPGTSPQDTQLALVLTAHSEPRAVPDPDCRPATATRPPPTLRCWGSLVLRVLASSPAAAGLTVVGFSEVHKVKAGESGCGDEQGGDCDGDESAGCEEGGCQGGGLAVATAAGSGSEPETGYVNGIAAVAAPGDTDLEKGQAVQVHITLYDSGTARYQNRIVVQVRPVGPMQDTIPWTYQSPPETTAHVRIHYAGTSG